jgi:hypothetical protein
MVASMRWKSPAALLMDTLKATALPEFGYEDDLNQMPHSVLMKIQMGGLAGLQKQMQAASELAPVADIQQMVSQALGRYGDIGAIPVSEFVQDMVNFNLPRRRR